MLLADKSKEAILEIYSKFKQNIQQTSIMFIQLIKKIIKFPNQVIKVWKYRPLTVKDSEVGLNGFFSNDP